MENKDCCCSEGLGREALVDEIIKNIGVLERAGPGAVQPLCLLLANFRTRSVAVEDSSSSSSTL